MFQQSYFSCPEEIWERAWEQAHERKQLADEGKGRGKPKSMRTMANELYHRTVQSRFDVAIGAQFGGTVRQS